MIIGVRKSPSSPHFLGAGGQGPLCFKQVLGACRNAGGDKGGEESKRDTPDPQGVSPLQVTAFFFCPKYFFEVKTETCSAALTTTTSADFFFWGGSLVDLFFACLRTYVYLSQVSRSSAAAVS